MIRPIDALAPKVYFKGPNEKSAAGETEKKVAIANAFGISAVTGAILTATSRSMVSSWKSAGGVGATTAGLMMLFLTPMFLYKTNAVSSLAKEKDGDTFTPEKNMSKKVNSVIDSKPNISGKLENYSKTLIRRI